MIRRINAILGLVVAILLAAHVLSMSLLLVGAIPFARWLKFLAYTFLALFLLHALLSVVVIFFFTEQGAGLQYAAMNLTTLLQRATAIVIVLLIHLHFSHYTSIAPDGSLIFLAPTPAMFLAETGMLLMVVLHTAVSVPKACISLGLTVTKRSMDVTRRLIYTASAALAVFGVIALCLYCF